MTDPSRRLDARSLRGIAHPLRMRILELLRFDGPATSTGLAARLGENTGTVSWHLRHLAEHGFIEEEVGRGTKRERWWRRSGEKLVLNTAEFRDNPEASGALSVWMDEFVRQQFTRVETSYRDADELGPEWMDARTLNDWSGLRLTASQLVALNAEVTALVERYLDLPEEPGAQSVVLQYQAFPRRSVNPAEGTGDDPPVDPGKGTSDDPPAGPNEGTSDDPPAGPDEDGTDKTPRASR
jgi:DNA-binding transcriptional ArsR family regulator